MQNQITRELYPKHSHPVVNCFYIQVRAHVQALNPKKTIYLAVVSVLRTNVMDKNHQSTKQMNKKWKSKVC